MEEGGKGVIKNEGGFKQGDTVTVSADMETGKVTWKVNGTIKASHKTDKLKRKKIKWVPYIWMWNEGDQIEWLD